MRVRLHVFAQDVSAPGAGASSTVGQLLDELPRRRPVTLAFVAHGLAPGTLPTPWVLRGVHEGLELASRRVSQVAGFGSREGVSLITERGLPRALASSASPTSHGLTGPLQRMAVRGGAEVRIPRAWIGSSLVLVCPASHVSAARGPWGAASGRVGSWAAGTAAPGADAWLGPTTAALAVLGATLPVVTPSLDARRSAALAASVCRDVFASTHFIVDATWWGAIDASGAVVGEVVSPELVLGTSHVDAADLEAIDAWWAERLRVRAASSLSARVDAESAWQASSAARLPELRRASTVAAAHGLASRAVAALRPSVTRPPLALSAPLPGAFARLWSTALAQGGGLHRAPRGPA